MRGLEKDTAVLCTPTQTFSLQRAHTSNMLIPIAPLVESKRKDHDTDMDMDMDTGMGLGSSLQADPYYINDPALEESPFGRQAALDILDSVLDLIPISPRLERLGEILAKSQFEGWAHESDFQVHICLLSCTLSGYMGHGRILTRELSNRIVGSFVHMGEPTIGYSGKR